MMTPHGPAWLTVAPYRVFIGLASATLAGCGAPPAAALQGDWRIVEIAGAAPAPGSAPALTFTGTRVSGTGGCNRIGGDIKPIGEGLRFGALISTMMACRQPLMEQERVFFDLLERVRRVSVEAPSRIELQPQSGPGILLERTP